ncbi:hypothetical protein V6N11_016079 [Hibiscus sabdariffa]|uniref:Uncharacterized protein n=1 Tax=Hibiscus sabdariffa TaxID=183260 RepID=A0ABR2TTW5_9ROSI
MDARRIPGLVKCIEDYQPYPPDLEQLALNEDSNINEVIKNHSLDAIAESGQVEQSITQRFKSTVVSPLREDGEDGKESNANLKSINAIDCVSSKSHEKRDSEAILDTSLSIENKEEVTKNGMLKLGVNPIQPK